MLLLEKFFHKKPRLSPSWSERFRAIVAKAADRAKPRVPDTEARHEEIKDQEASEPLRSRHGSV
jgi:hypothetical protein